MAVSEYVSSMRTQNADALSGAAQEVDLVADHGAVITHPQTNQMSETIEVEDIVSADTNNQQFNNMQSFRTGSHVFNQDNQNMAHTKRTQDTEDELYQL